MARSSFARSKGSRFPSFLTTVRSRSWTRSKVVNRAPQPSHWRRRRIAAPSSDGRLSLTWLASCAQNGQRIRTSVLVDGEAGAQIADLPVHACLDLAIPLEAVRSQPVENIRDHVGDVAEFGLAEAARRAGGRSHPDPAGLDRRQRIERDAVLVAGDPRAFEALVGVLAGEAQGLEVDKRDMGIGPPRDEVGTALLQPV